MKLRVLQVLALLSRHQDNRTWWSLHVL